MNIDLVGTYINYHWPDGGKSVVTYFNPKLVEGRRARQTLQRKGLLALLVFATQISVELERPAGATADRDVGLRQKDIEKLRQVGVGNRRFNRGGQFFI